MGKTIFTLREVRNLEREHVRRHGDPFAGLGPPRAEKARGEKRATKAMSLNSPATAPATRTMPDVWLTRPLPQDDPFAAPPSASTVAEEVSHCVAALCLNVPFDAVSCAREGSHVRFKSWDGVSGRDRAIIALAGVIGRYRADFGRDATPPRNWRELEGEIGVSDALQVRLGLGSPPQQSDLESALDYASYVLGNHRPQADALTAALKASPAGFLSGDEAEAIWRRTS